MPIETLGAALRQIKRLFTDGVISGLPDAQLLDRFIEQRDPGAFEALVARHGPMVLSVCRGILRDPNDAEDAFQATFLVMVKKAGTIHGRHTLGGWLYQVANRVAIQANKAVARRRTYEREAGQMAAAITPSGPAIPDELLPALHEEIARMPEKYRLALVLCDLEGMTQIQAAGELGWSERTLRRRLAEARERLKRRLGRRGLIPDDAMLGAAFLREARALVPAAWQEATVRAALDLVNHTVTAGAVSAAAGSLTREVLNIMLVQKLKLASAALIAVGVTAWAASAALISRGDEPGRKASVLPPVAQRAAPAPAPRPEAERESDPLDAVGTFPVHGRVIDPDGKPLAGAEIFIRPNNELGLAGSDAAVPAPKGQKGRVAVSGADGRFRFDLDKASSDFPYADEPAWHTAQIAAVAPRSAMAWVEAGSLINGDEATLRLVRDDLPIRGRVLDLQGRPVAGATVRLRQIGTAKDGVDLDAMVASGELDNDQTSAWYGGYHDAIWPGGPNTWTADADGRFEVKGVGRDRIAALEIHGLMLARSTFYAMARPAKTEAKPHPHPTRRNRDMMFFGSPPKPPLFGATFEHVVGPTKPITGVVRSKTTGQPIEGVKVYGQEGATWTSVGARTDAQGRFRLVGLPKGEVYQVSANNGYEAVAPFLGAEIKVTDTEGLKPIETTLELPRGVIVTGRLIDTATGRPVRAGQISYCKLPTNPNAGDGTQALKSPTGPTFRMTVPPGGGMIYVEARDKDRYTRARLRKADKGKGVGGQGDGEPRTVILNGCHAYKIVDIPADARSFHIDLELTRGFTRKGRVVDPDGKPVAGAQCYGLSPTWGDMTSLANDTFEVRGLDPDHRRQLIFAHKDRRLVGSVIIKGEDSKTDQPLVVRLDRPGSIKGRLVDEDGMPLAGALIETMSIDLDGSNLPPGPGRDAMWPDSDTVTTGADGRFQVDGLKPGIKTISGVTFKDRLELSGDTGKVLRDIVIQQPGEVRDLGDIKVKVARQ